MLITCIWARFRFRFIYSKIHIHQKLQRAQMERQARLLGKTYKQNLTILIDTEQTKNEPLFHKKKTKKTKKNTIFNESI